MKYTWIIFLLVLLGGCNTDYNYIDSGLANGRFDGNMYEYFRANRYDWDSTRVMIERAGLVDLFEGKRAGYEKITFFGPTTFSILRWMLEKRYERIADIPVELCEELILCHVVKGIQMRDDIPRGERIANQAQGKGGVVLTSAFGSQMWVYSFREPYEDIPDVGPVVLYISSFVSQSYINVISTNIESDNGVVHSLYYDYSMTLLKDNN